MIPSRLEKPSISVRIWLSVCSCSLEPPIAICPRARPIESSSSMKMIAGACSRACLNRSRTRAAPTPTIISTNSEPLIEKNGTPASPATARASSVLPVPGAPIEQHALRRGTAEPRVLLRVPQEVHDLDQLVLGLVDAGDVVERDLAPPAPGRSAARCSGRCRERRRPAAALLRGAPEHPDVEADDQQRRGEAEQQRRPRAALLDRLGADLDAVADEQRLEARVREGGELGGEVGHRARPRADPRVRGVSRRSRGYVTG